jgi:dihydrolipoyl dehydrogenase
MAESFDVVVIGAGPGGYVAAIRAAQLGMSVACIDRRATLGGTCLNVGCIPSKALLDSSELYAQARKHLGEHGIQVGDVQLDLSVLLARKDAVVKGLTSGIAGLFRKNKITFYQGTARLAARQEGSPHGITIKNEGKEEKRLQAKNVILATGSEPIRLSALPFDGSSIVSSTEALTFEKVPTHLIVIGGGYIGLELGSVWSRLGSKVTVVEALPRIIPHADTEIAELLQKSLAKQGLTFHLETRVESGSAQGGQVIVNARSKGKDVLLQGDRVLVAVGRRPYTSGLGLAEAGVEIDEKSGRVTTNDAWETAIPGIYAIGDLIEGPMLAHKAEDEGMAVAERLAGKKTHVNLDTIPGVIYTWPEVASVGKTEEQAKEGGREVRIGKFPFQASGRARCMAETEGVVKMIADARTDRLLGVHIFGPRASELIAECVAVMDYAGSSEDIARICHAHPTLSEAVREAALAVDRRAIHL